VLFLNVLIWSGGVGFQVQFTRDTVHTPWDWTVPAAVGPIIHIMACECDFCAFSGRERCTYGSVGVGDAQQGARSDVGLGLRREREGRGRG
jgi:hypothetical protein